MRLKDAIDNADFCQLQTNSTHGTPINLKLTKTALRDFLFHKVGPSRRYRCEMLNLQIGKDGAETFEEGFYFDKALSASINWTNTEPPNHLVFTLFVR